MALLLRSSLPGSRFCRSSGHMRPTDVFPQNIWAGGALAAECGAGLPCTGAPRVTGSPAPARPERRSPPGRLLYCPGRGLAWPFSLGVAWGAAVLLALGPAWSREMRLSAQLKALHPLKQRRAAEQPGQPAWGPRGRRQPYSPSEWTLMACLLQLTWRMQCFLQLADQRRRHGAGQGTPMPNWGPPDAAERGCRARLGGVSALPSGRGQVWAEIGRAHV